MVISESRLLPVCRICKGEIDGARLRKCVGLGASMLFYGLKRDQVNPALAELGEPPLPELPDLRIWCEACAERILRRPADGRGRGGDCALCLKRVRVHSEDRGLLAEPGCLLAWPGLDPRPLCLDCRAHVFFKDGR